MSCSGSFDEESSELSPSESPSTSVAVPVAEADQLMQDDEVEETLMDEDAGEDEEQEDDPEDEEAEEAVDEPVQKVQAPKKGKKKRSFSRRKGLRFTVDNNLRCRWCHKMFKFTSMLRVHERTHTGEKPYKCNLCDKAFAQNASLQTHIRRHRGEKPYACPYCGKGFASQGNMRIHERQHTGYKPYNCEECGKQFATNGALKTHEITHSDLKQFSCDICGREFAHRTSLYTHRKRHEMNEEGADEKPSPKTPTTPKEKRHECEYCGKRFPYRYPLVAHLRTHTGEKPFHCQYCDKSFAQQASLIMHHRSHTGDRRYACEICGRRFIQPAALNAHRRTHTGERPFKCAQCPKAFAHATSLRQHQAVHESGGEGQSPEKKNNSGEGKELASPSEKPLHTCFCGKSFRFQSVLEAHMRRHTGEKPFECSYCKKHFAQKATLQVHERTHTGERPYKCRFCDRTFAQIGTKSVHERTHLGITSRNHKCNVCGKMLASPSSLYTHKKTHGERVHQCNQCDKSFTVSNYLKLHVKTVHCKEKNEHICPFCGKSFPYSGSLQVHIRTHTGERPYSCRYCPKAFASQGNLQSHERTHTGEKPYICGMCGRGFAQKPQLNVHEAAHARKAAQQVHAIAAATGTGEQALPPSLRTSAGGVGSDFECKYCGKKFAYASSLYVHTRLHTGERPYKCAYCDKTFTNQGNMQVHERVHTGEKPFRCLNCGKSYAQKVGLRIHMEQCGPARMGNGLCLSGLNGLSPGGGPLGGLPPHLLALASSSPGLFSQALSAGLMSGVDPALALLAATQAVTRKNGGDLLQIKTEIDDSPQEGTQAQESPLTTSRPLPGGLFPPGAAGPQPTSSGLTFYSSLDPTMSLAFPPALRNPGPPTGAHPQGSPATPPPSSSAYDNANVSTPEMLLENTEPLDVKPTTAPLPPLGIGSGHSGPVGPAGPWSPFGSVPSGPHDFLSRGSAGANVGAVGGLPGPSGLPTGLPSPVGAPASHHANPPPGSPAFWAAAAAAAANQNAAFALAAGLMASQNIMPMKNQGNSGPPQPSRPPATGGLDPLTSLLLASNSPLSSPHAGQPSGSSPFAGLGAGPLHDPSGDSAHTSPTQADLPLSSASASSSSSRRKCSLPLQVSMQDNNDDTELLSAEMRNRSALSGKSQESSNPINCCSPPTTASDTSNVEHSQIQPVFFPYHPSTSSLTHPPATHQVHCVDEQSQVPPTSGYTNNNDDVIGSRVRADDVIALRDSPPSRERLVSVASAAPSVVVATDLRHSPVLNLEATSAASGRKFVVNVPDLLISATETPTPTSVL